MKNEKDCSNVIYRENYQPPAYLISHIDLVIDLSETETVVHATSKVKRHTSPKQDLILDGGHQSLLSVSINGEQLDSSQYYINKSDHKLIIPQVPDEFELTTVCKVNPKENRKIAKGLYFTSGQYVTQNEPQGFRGITYFIDRPDNLATYSTEIRAPKSSFPVLLSNGNLIDTKQLEDGRHAAKWFDPVPKPSYLFAIVAGDLMAVEDHFLTQSGKDVILKAFVPSEDISRVSVALKSLKQALRWKEIEYGIEYDLDNYKLAQAHDFNAGAMENKGLNVFNRSRMLAHKEISTDNSVFFTRKSVYHESAHNEFGNRTSPQSWFELFVKEGWATYLEQKCNHYYLGQLAARRRIIAVEMIRARQFPEEMSAVGHSVQLDSYKEIRNFYTSTTYLKGAELLHVLERFIGEDAMREGVKHFLKIHDGKSVTVDDVLQSMFLVSGKDLTQFKLWYSQAGTPEISIHEKYNADDKTYILTISQNTPCKEGEATKLPFVIPISIALLSQNGTPLEAHLDESEEHSSEHMLILNQSSQTFSFSQVDEKPVLSALRNFSAPVKIIESPNTVQDQGIIIKNENDWVQRWNIAQQLFLDCITDIVKANSTLNSKLKVALDAFKHVLCDSKIPPGIRADILKTPSLSTLLREMPGNTPEELLHACQTWDTLIGKTFKNEFRDIYQNMIKNGSEELDDESASIRALKNRCLHFLSQDGSPESLERLQYQYLSSRNFTDRICVLSKLCESNDPVWLELSKVLLDEMYKSWKHEPIVMETWLSLQASVNSTQAIDNVKSLLDHPAYDESNPNLVLRLLGTFSKNIIAFHEANGKGYKLIADAILRIDQINPHSAASICRVLTEWHSLDKGRQHLMTGELVRISHAKNLSSELREIVMHGLDLAKTEGLLVENNNDSLHKLNILWEQCCLMSTKNKMENPNQPEIKLKGQNVPTIQ